MKTILIILCLVMQSSSSFFDDFEESISSMKNTIENAINNVLSNVQITIDCSILVVQQVLELDDEPSEYDKKCREKSEIDKDETPKVQSVMLPAPQVVQDLNSHDVIFTNDNTRFKSQNNKDVLKAANNFPEKSATLGKELDSILIDCSSHKSSIYVNNILNKGEKTDKDALKTKEMSQKKLKSLETDTNTTSDKDVIKIINPTNYTNNTQAALEKQLKMLQSVNSGNMEQSKQTSPEDKKDEKLLKSNYNTTLKKIIKSNINQQLQEANDTLRKPLMNNATISNTLQTYESTNNKDDSTNIIKALHPEKNNTLIDLENQLKGMKSKGFSNIVLGEKNIQDTKANKEELLKYDYNIGPKDVSKKIFKSSNKQDNDMVDRAVENNRTNNLVKDDMKIINILTTEKGINKAKIDLEKQQENLKSQSFDTSELGRETTQRKEKEKNVTDDFYIRNIYGNRSESNNSLENFQVYNNIENISSLVYENYPATHTTVRNDLRNNTATILNDYLSKINGSISQSLLSNNTSTNETKTNDMETNLEDEVEVPNNFSTEFDQESLDDWEDDSEEDDSLDSNDSEEDMDSNESTQTPRETKNSRNL